jgi:hypothetical protein
MELVAIGKSEELEAAYFASRCESYVQRRPVLAIARFVSDTHALLPDGLARKPEVMIKRRGDDNWVGIANRALSALLFVLLIGPCVGCAESRAMRLRGRSVARHSADFADAFPVFDADATAKSAGCPSSGDLSVGAEHQPRGGGGAGRAVVIWRVIHWAILTATFPAWPDRNIVARRAGRSGRSSQTGGG